MKEWSEKSKEITTGKMLWKLIVLRLFKSRVENHKALRERTEYFCEILEKGFTKN